MKRPAAENSGVKKKQKLDDDIDLLLKEFDRSRDWTLLLDVSRVVDRARVERLLGCVTAEPPSSGTRLEDRDLLALAVLLNLRARDTPGVSSDLVTARVAAVKKVLRRSDEADPLRTRSASIRCCLEALFPALPHVTAAEGSALLTTFYPLVIRTESEANVLLASQILTELDPVDRKANRPTLFEDLFLSAELSDKVSASDLRLTLFHYISLNASAAAAGGEEEEKPSAAKAPRCVRLFYSELPDWPGGHTLADWELSELTTFSKHWQQMASRFCYLLIAAIAKGGSNQSFDGKRKSLTAFCNTVIACVKVAPMYLVFLNSLSDALCSASSEHDASVSRLCLECLPSLYSELRELQDLCATGAETLLSDRCSVCGLPAAVSPQRISDNTEMLDGSVKREPPPSVRDSISGSEGCASAASVSVEVSARTSATMDEPKTAVICLQCGVNCGHTTCVGDDDWICEPCEVQNVSLDSHGYILERWSSCFDSEVVMSTLARRHPTEAASRGHYRCTKPPLAWAKLIVKYNIVSPATEAERTLLISFLQRRDAGAGGNRPTDAPAAANDPPPAAPLNGEEAATAEVELDEDHEAEIDAMIPRVKLKHEAVDGRVPLHRCERELLQLTLLYLLRATGPRPTARTGKVGDATRTRLLLEGQKITSKNKILNKILKSENIKIISSISLRRLDHLIEAEEPGGGGPAAASTFLKLYNSIMNKRLKNIEPKKNICKNVRRFLDEERNRTTAEAEADGLITTTLLGRCVKIKNNNTNQYSYLKILIRWVLSLFNEDVIESDIRRWPSYKVEVFKILIQISAHIEAQAPRAWAAGGPAGASGEEFLIVMSIDKILIKNINMEFKNSQCFKIFQEFVSDFSARLLNRLLEDDVGESERMVILKRIINFYLTIELYNIKIIDSAKGIPIDIFEASLEGSVAAGAAGSASGTSAHIIRVLTHSLLRIANDFEGGAAGPPPSAEAIYIQTGILRVMSLVMNLKSFSNIRIILPWMMSVLKRVPSDQKTSYRSYCIMQILIKIPKESWLMSISSPLKDLQMCLLNLSRVHGRTSEAAITLLIKISKQNQNLKFILSALLNSDIQKLTAKAEAAAAAAAETAGGKQIDAAARPLPVGALRHVCHKIETIFKLLNPEEIDEFSKILNFPKGYDLLRFLFNLLKDIFYQTGAVTQVLGSNPGAENSAGSNPPGSNPTTVSAAPPPDASYVILALSSLALCDSELFHDGDWSIILSHCVSSKASVSEFLNGLEVSIQLLTRRGGGAAAGGGASTGGNTLGGGGTFSAGVTLKSRGPNKSGGPGAGGTASCLSVGGGKLQLLALPRVIDIICNRGDRSMMDRAALEASSNVSSTSNSALLTSSSAFPSSAPPVSSSATTSSGEIAIIRKCIEYIHELFEQGIIPTAVLIEPILISLLYHNEDHIIKQKGYYLSKTIINQSIDAQGSIKRKMFSFVISCFNVLVQRRKVPGPPPDQPDAAGHAPGLVLLGDLDYFSEFAMVHLFYKEMLKSQWRNNFVNSVISTILKTIGTISDLSEAIQRIQNYQHSVFGLTSQLIFNQYVREGSVQPARLQGGLRPPEHVPSGGDPASDPPPPSRTMLINFFMLISFISKMIVTWPYDKDSHADQNFAIEILSDVRKTVHTLPYSSRDDSENIILLYARVWTIINLQIVERALVESLLPPSKAKDAGGGGGAGEHFVDQVVKTAHSVLDNNEHGQLDLSASLDGTSCDQLSAILNRKISLWFGSTLDGAVASAAL